MLRLLMLTTAIALFFVLRGNIQQHRQWMTRSYAVALVFLEVRVISGVFGFDNNPMATEIIVWMCVIFAVPIADIVLNWREFKRGKITQQQSCGSKSSLGTIAQYPIRFAYFRCGVASLSLYMYLMLGL